MQDHIDVLGQGDGGLLVGQVADNQLLALGGFAHVHTVHKAHVFGQVLEATAQLGAEAARRAGDQDTVEFGHVFSFAMARIWLRVCPGVRDSGLTTSSSTAPLSEALARSNAAAKSAVRVTFSP